MESHFPTLMNSRIPGLAVVCSLLLLSGCEPDNGTTGSNPQFNSQTNIEHPGALTISPLVPPFLTTAQEVHLQLREATAAMDTHIIELVTAPSAEKLEASRKAWQTAHSLLTAAKLFQYLPVKHPELYSGSELDPESTGEDNTNEASTKHSLWVQLDQAPLLPGYLDSVQGYPLSGLVHSEMSLTREALLAQHQFADTYYVAVGFHALEFLLWGESGARPISDFLVPETAEVSPEARRLRLIKIISSLAAEDTNRLCSIWLNDSSYFTKKITDGTSRHFQEQTVLEAIRGSIYHQIHDSDMGSLSLSHSEFSAAGKTDLSALLSFIQSFTGIPEVTARLNELDKKDTDISLIQLINELGKQISEWPTEAGTKQAKDDNVLDAQQRAVSRITHLQKQIDSRLNALINQ
ncbi:imelysin family protein [Oleiphilus messinensis]|uniref:imelysin family protein n=1 Tax=Oleiphilus messinensis TaxID=141451 RepID=UPI0012FAD045|nr:imelysin family protein [Oleiphilus messinensis]